MKQLQDAEEHPTHLSILIHLQYDKSRIQVMSQGTTLTISLQIHQLLSKYFELVISIWKWHINPFMQIIFKNQETGILEIYIYRPHMWLGMLTE